MEIIGICTLCERFSLTETEAEEAAQIYSKQIY